MQGAARYELYSRSERLRRIERLVAVCVNDCKRIFDVAVVTVTNCLGLRNFLVRCVGTLWR